MKSISQKVFITVLIACFVFSLAFGTTLAYVTRSTENRVNRFNFSSSSKAINAILTEPDWDGVIDYEYQESPASQTSIYDWIDDDSDPQTPKVPVYGYENSDKSKPITDKSKLSDTVTRAYKDSNDSSYAPVYGIDIAQNMLWGDTAPKNPIITNKGSVDIWVAIKATFVYSEKSENAGLRLTDEDLQNVLAATEINYQVDADDDWERVEGTENDLSQVFYYKHILGKDKNLDDVGIYGEVTTPVFTTVKIKNTATREQINALHAMGGFSLWVEGFAAQSDVSDTYEEFKAWGLSNGTNDGGVVFNNTPDDAPPPFTYTLLSSDPVTDSDGNVYDGTVTLNGYTGTLTSLLVPKTVRGLRTLNLNTQKITYDDNGKTYLVIGVEGTGTNSAMYGLKNIKNIVLSDNLETIGDYAFYNTGIKGSIIVPESVKVIGENVFTGCTITDFEIPASLYPNTYGFNFSEISYYGELPFTWDVLTSKSFVDENGISYDGTAEITGYTGNDTTVILPYSVNGIRLLTDRGDNVSTGTTSYTKNDKYYKIESISGTTSLCAYGMSNVANVVFPESLKTIGNYAFYNCKNISGGLELPNKITSIGNYAFCNSGITGTLNIPSNVTSIGNYAFKSCTGLTNGLIIPASVETIGSHAFMDCTSLTTLTLNEGLKSIGSQAFYTCYLTQTLTIPSTVTQIGANAFANCRYSAIKVSAGNTVYASVNNVLFDINITTLIQYPTKNTATSYTIPSTVNKVCDLAFYRCYSLKSITIPNSVTTIGNKTFTYCTKLTGTVTVPQSVTSIGNNAFNQCTSITLLRLPDRFANNTFGFTGTVEYYSK